MSGAAAKELLGRLMPAYQGKLVNLLEKRRSTLWGSTRLTLRLRKYPKSKDE